MRLKLNTKALREFESQCKQVPILRSIELATIAFEKGILDKYTVSVPHAKRELLESVLWGLKLNGASVTDDEINAIVKAEKI